MPQPKIFHPFREKVVVFIALTLLWNHSCSFKHQFSDIICLFPIILSVSMYHCEVLSSWPDKKIQNLDATLRPSTSRKGLPHLTSAVEKDFVIKKFLQGLYFENLYLIIRKHGHYFILSSEIINAKLSLNSKRKLNCDLFYFYH